jgi:hypothetical protein
VTSLALKRADDLAEQASYLISEHGFGRLQPFGEEAAELRTAAFIFAREVRGSEPLIVMARDVAGAVLELLSQLLYTADSVEKLHKASNAYKQARSGSDAPVASRA